jgi:hypothetical protein
MNFLRRLFSGGAQSPPDNALHLYVRCARCGSPVHVRINPANDLSAEYGESEVSGYQLRKEIMDAKCFRIMRAELDFDRNRRETSRTISGGEFITKEAYDLLVAQ